MAEDEETIEHRIEQALCSRLQHFKDQADSLTLESVRRLLEKDLGLDKFALDAHKRFIKLSLEKKMDSEDSRTATEKVDRDVHLSKEEAKVFPKQDDTKNVSKKAGTGDEEVMEDSPIMGILTPKSEVGSQDHPLSESRIEKAIWDRAEHFLSNSEITLAGVRRLLEEDLGLDKYTLDPFKKFINQQVDLVMSSPKGAKSVKDVKKKTSEGSNKKTNKVSSEEGPESSHSESDEMEDKVKSRKEVSSKRNTKKSERPKKRKISTESDLDVSDKKKSKLAKSKKEEDNESNEDGNLSEDGQSSSDKTTQRKEKSVAGYGKKVENLKSIIKACGMSVPPIIYKKAKQEPDNKREAFIVKELEGILSREGLSKNPTEKEIKDCKKRKETARELEGIDMTNIISSSRRRSTFSFVAPVEPKIRSKKDKAGAEDSKSKDKEEKNNDNDNEDEEEKKVKETKEDKEEEVDEEVEDEEEEEEEEDEEDESEEFSEDDNDESD